MEKKDKKERRNELVTGPGKNCETTIAKKKKATTKMDK